MNRFDVGRRADGPDQKVLGGKEGRQSWLAPDGVHGHTPLRELPRNGQRVVIRGTAVGEAIARFAQPVWGRVCNEHGHLGGVGVPLHVQDLEQRIRYGLCCWDLPW